MKAKRCTSFRLTPEALQMLAVLAEKSGVSQTAILELLIREKGRTEHYHPPHKKT